MGFLDFDDYQGLVNAAKSWDASAHLVVLLGGDAGLRCGEMMALRWEDVNLKKRQLRIQRSDWKGHVTSTKGGRVRYVPMTARLAGALQGHRHLRSELVLCQDDGLALTQKIVQVYVRRVGRRALVPKVGVHMLRHTFCSHLAMRGAPARAIRNWQGTRTSRQRRGTCTSVRQPSKAQFGCWSPRGPSRGVETKWRRHRARTISPCDRAG